MANRVPELQRACKTVGASGGDGKKKTEGCWRKTTMSEETFRGKAVGKDWENSELLEEMVA